MKKSLICAAILGATAALSAQAANVDVYGVIDSYVEAYYNGVQTTGRLSSGGAGGSRLGLRGTEDLGNGTQVFFSLEMGLLNDIGTSTPEGRGAGYLFQREVSLGVKNDLGRLSFGRQYTPNFVTYVTTDFTGMSLGSAIGTFCAPNRVANINGGVGPDGSTRRDNSISYGSPSFGGLSFEAYAALGEQKKTSGDLSSTDGNLYNVAMRYRAEKLRASVALMALNESVQGYDGKSYTAQAAASYDFGITRANVIAVYKKANDTVANPDIYAVQLGAATPLLNGTLHTTVAYLDNTTQNDANALAYGVRFDYPMSKRTKVYAGLAGVRNDDNASYNLSAGGGSSAGLNQLPGNGARTVFMGLNHKF